jgi:hypothetical protein
MTSHPLKEAGWFKELLHKPDLVNAHIEEEFAKLYQSSLTQT